MNLREVKNASSILRFLRLFVFIFSWLFLIACKTQQSVVAENLVIKIHSYESENQIKASAMPELKSNSELRQFRRRFEYLILNVPEFHSPNMFEERMRLFNLYPDTLKMKKLIMEQYVSDDNFSRYFVQTYSAIKNPKRVNKLTFSKDEVLEVASRFFHCDEVKSDTTVQARVCVGMNGLNELKMDKDFTLLAAFCYEAIFYDFDLEDSKISRAWHDEKQESIIHNKPNITSLDSFLIDVRNELYLRMKSNEFLVDGLMRYYDMNKENLAFVITE